MWNHSAIASLNRTFHLSPHENILTIALMNIHYLYNNKSVKMLNIVLYRVGFLIIRHDLVFTGDVVSPVELM